MAVEITMYAVPLDSEIPAREVAVECSVCGPVTITHPTETGEVIGDHLREHGCDLSQVVYEEKNEERREG